MQRARNTWRWWLPRRRLTACELEDLRADRARSGRARRTPPVERLPRLSGWPRHIRRAERGAGGHLPSRTTRRGGCPRHPHRIPRNGEEFKIPLHHHGSKPTFATWRGEDRAHRYVRPVSAHSPHSTLSSNGTPRPKGDPGKDGAVPSKRRQHLRLLAHPSSARGRRTRHQEWWGSGSHQAVCDASRPKDSRRSRPTCTTARRPVSRTTRASSSWR